MFDYLAYLKGSIMFYLIVFVILNLNCTISLYDVEE